MTIEQALLGYNSRLTNEILDNPDFIEATATGKFRDFINSAESYELQSEPDKVEFTKFGTSYTTALDEGTPAGTPTIASDIFEWMKAKGVFPVVNMGIAESIARRIERFGSMKHRNPEMRTTIIADAIAKAEPTLFELLDKAHVLSTQATINKAINEKIQ